MILLLLLPQFFMNVSLPVKSFVVRLLLISSEILDDLVFCRAPSLRRGKSVSNLSLARPTSGCQITRFCTRKCSARQLLSLNQRRMNLSSSRSHPASTQKLCDVKIFEFLLELLAHYLWERLFQQYSQTSFLSGGCADWAMGWHSEVLVGTPGAHVDCDWRVRAMHRHVCASKWMMQSTLTSCEHSLFFDTVS